MTDRSTSPLRRGVILMALGVGLLVGAAPAAAEPIKCQRAILKQADLLGQAIAKTLRQCEEQKRKGRLPLVTDCTAEPKTAAKIAKIETKLAAKVTKACGGKDKTCGTADDDAPGDIGWPATCPDFAGTGCTNAIADCDDVSQCLACVNGTAVTAAVALAYDALVPTDKRQQRKLHKCQATIGSELVKLYGKSSKPRVRCWDQRYKGKHANACPDPGDGKAAANIAKAGSKLVAKVCRACGGGDKACGGGDDFSPVEIGFVASCPAVGGCGGSVTTLGDVADCLACVADFDAACAVDLGVPGLVSYPAACAAAVPTPTITPTTTSQPSASTTPIVIATPTPTATQTDQPTATPTADVPAPTPTTTPVPSATITGTPGPGATATLTATITPTATPTVTIAPTPSATATLTAPATPSATATATPTSTATATPTATPAATATSTPTATITITPTPVATATVTATPTTAGATPTPTPGAALCTLANPPATTLVSVTLAGSPIGAASLLVAYPPTLVRLPEAGGGAAVRARVSDLTGGELFDAGSPNNQDSDANQAPDRVRLSLVSTSGVTGPILTIELDRCDAPPPQANDFSCALEHVVAIDGVTPVPGVSCSVALVP